MYSPEEYGGSDYGIGPVNGGVYQMDDTNSIAAPRKKNRFASFLNGLSGQNGGRGGLIGGLQSAGIGGGAVNALSNGGILGLARFML